MLHLGPKLTMPDEAVTETLVVYGGKGMGKTVFGAVLAEECVARKKRFSFIDPVGRSWGLRYAADGKSPGLDILILGGRHGDIPIEPTGGKVVADLVIDEYVNTLIDISSNQQGEGWSHSQKLRFVADYATRLYERGQAKRRPMMQIIDEAGRFAQQQIAHGDAHASQCLGALEQLVELGRNAGIGVCLITQRSARMAKSVSELASALIAFRTIGPNSVKAILDWFGEHVKKSEWDTLLGQLRELDKGQALVVSPGWLKIEGSYQIRMRDTFDSSATPKGGGEREVRGGKAPDLKKYQERMAETIAKAEASDPTKLQRKLADVVAKLAAAEKRIEQLSSRPAATEQVEKIIEKVKTVPVMTDKHAQQMRDKFDRFIKEIGGPLADLKARLDKVMAGVVPIPVGILPPNTHAVRKFAPLPAAAPPKPAPVIHKADKPTKVADPAAAPRAGLRRMMIAMAQCPAGLTRKQIAVRAGMAQSGTFGTYLSNAHTQGWVTTIGKTSVLTDEGLQALGEYEPLPTGKALYDYWVNEIGESNGAARMLVAAYAAGAEGCTKLELAAAAGMTVSGTFGTYLSKLATLNLIERRDGRIYADKDLY